MFHVITNGDGKGAVLLNHRVVEERMSNLIAGTREITTRFEITIQQTVHANESPDDIEKRREWHKRLILKTRVMRSELITWPGSKNGEVRDVSSTCTED